MQKGTEVDVIWTQTSTNLEHNLAAIEFPLFRGYSGYRIFLIRKQEQDKFNRITNEEQLKQLVAGQVSFWPDVNVLKSNKYHMVEANTQQSLLSMLLHERFDYMPRTIPEAYREALQYDGLTVEKSIALYYPQTYYFFVNKNNTRLKERIELGFSKIERNGVLKQYFENHQDTQRYMYFNKSEQRTVFKLNIE